jgi:hypothetical protein
MVFRLGREIRQFFYHKLNTDTVTIALGLGLGLGLERRSRFDGVVRNENLLGCAFGMLKQRLHIYPRTKCLGYLFFIP